MIQPLTVSKLSLAFFGKVSALYPNMPGDQVQVIADALAELALETFQEWGYRQTNDPQADVPAIPENLKNLNVEQTTDLARFRIIGRTEARLILGLPAKSEEDGVRETVFKGFRALAECAKEQVDRPESAE
jgi:hypothetical protein